MTREVVAVACNYAAGTKIARDGARCYLLWRTGGAGSWRGALAPRHRPHHDPASDSLFGLLREERLLTMSSADLKPPSGWIDRAVARFERTRSMNPDTTIIIHAFGCHLTHVPIGNYAALADLSAGVDRDKWGWHPIEPAAVRGRIDRDRSVRVIVTEAVTPTAEAMLVADGLDPLVIRLARAEEWR